MGDSHSSEERKKEKQKSSKGYRKNRKEQQKQVAQKKSKSEAQLLQDMRQKQQQEIIKEIEQDPLVTQKIDIQFLLEDYSNNEQFTQKIIDLIENKKKKQIRKTRRDGSCFYRCFIYMLFEKLLENYKLVEQLHILDKIKLGQTVLENAGFDKAVYIEPQNLFLKIINRINQQNITMKRIEDFLNNKLYFDYIVLYLRYLISAFIQTQREQYKCYFENTQQLLKFCQNEVEPIDSDCDQIQIMTLHNFFEIPIRIFYVDNSKGNQTTCFSLPDITPNDNQQIITTDKDYLIQVVYKPGHYDMIY